MSRILITSGPTRQYLDPVRYLSNASSGRMGAALAAAAVEAGHDKTFAETERLVCEATKQIKESLTGVANSIRLTNEETLREMENARLREQLDESRAHNVTPAPSGVVQR